ncbi:hypothetical protein GRF29_164g916476 [Pseudopithomyces chartarum]|uniref:Dolichyl-diphosphooligosaccharide-protein glycosyltransferase subunit OST5 n=1 Tax=Pseudopithomyces chartarum TaxID=1892770 RepID=A0AAN6RDR5_9PLEO|nr:hypothetical protein GRF29_164g916476 [Pseudopithomyces chartarum]
MSTPLLDVWEAAASSPYSPSVSKDSQFTIGASLLLIALLLAGVFGLSMHTRNPRHEFATDPPDRSFVNLPLLGVPASLAFGFGAVYMICAVGVYV